MSGSYQIPPQCRASTTPAYTAPVTSTSSHKPSSSSASSQSKSLPPEAAAPSKSTHSSSSSSSHVRFQHRRHHSAFASLNTSSDNFCPKVKRGLCFTAGSGASANVKAVMRNPVPLTDQHEFDTLPPAIRRKYFSSLERLRYAQQQQQLSAVVQSPPSHFRSFSTVTRIRGSSRDSNDNLRCNSLRQRQLKLRKQSKGDACPLSQTDAKWFLDLPETIKRKHFSPEERYALTRKCESIIVDAADEKLYRMNHQSRRDSLDSMVTDTLRTESIHRRSIDSDIVHATNEVRNSFRWMDEDCDLDLQLLQFTDPLNKQPHRTGSKRRSLSITSSTARADASRPQSGARTRSTTLARRASVQRPTPRESPASRQSIDADALYYLDPRARLQLRVYLASPQKFDEAVEFGFPSQTVPHRLFKSRPLEPTIRKVSVESIDLDEKPDQEQFSSPMPVELEKPDIDNGDRIIHSAKGPHCVLDRYPHDSTGDRKMTLRMTLTRKDLRGEDVTPPVTAESIWELAELPPENTTIDWDTIDREAGSGIRRLWRRMIGH